MLDIKITHHSLSAVLVISYVYPFSFLLFFIVPAPYATTIITGRCL